MQIQLSRLFGEESRHASSSKKTTAEWRKTLKAVLKEIALYLETNVDTDEFHRMILYSGLAGAQEALKQDDFWLGYVEGITRLSLILLGDYPDHRRRRSGRKDKNYYKLDRYRSIQYSQTPRQRLNTLFAAGSAGLPKLSANPMDVLRQFRDQYGFKPTQDDFLEWYRCNRPEDYAAVFR
ncbi:MAG: hypothetical protein WAL45_15640 [Terracidiphilus sp.]